MKETIVVHGIVLKNDCCNEADIRCRLLTPNGIITKTAAGAMHAKAKLKNAVQLFTIAEFTTAGARITGAAVLQSGMSVTHEMHRYYLACAVCGTLLNLNRGISSSQESDTAAPIFLLTAHCFDALANTNTSSYKLLISYFTKLLVLLGYDIDTDDTPTAAKFEEFKTAPDTDTDKITLSHTQAKQCVKLLAEAFQEHLEIQIPCLNEF